ncbi:MAG: family 20 glycosylhydrolase [Verrucomicrobia bacterium]|nr:family 20 glycosylhydrolase [Verrucomicrobiota bacterium]
MKKPFLGFHYDIARGSYLKPETFCRALRLAAQSGYTHFLPYLENMIRLPALAKACPPCAYTAADWRRFESVAKAAGIELVPHFNVIGHTERIIPSYPELSGPAERGRLDLDVTRAAARDWTLRCLGEFCEFSRRGYFLIGGDEWQPPRHLLARPGFDVAAAWVNQINLAVEFLAKRGRKPIVWHDMLIHYPAALRALSRKAVIAFWFYDEDSDYPALDMFKQHGFETLMATAVYGGGAPTMGRRCVNAQRCAAAAVKKHGADGVIVTTWEFARWEIQAFNIPASVRVLRGEEPPAAIVDALSLWQTWQKLPLDSAVAGELKARALQLLQAPEWAHCSDLRRCLRASLKGDAKDDVKSYTQFHFPQGRIYEMVAKRSRRPTWSPTPPVAKPLGGARSFGLKVESAAAAGDALRFRNGDESFTVYPKFGASLQDWRRGGDLLIPASMDGLLKQGALPGGYRSYSAAGGFFPIWALGTHSNPCILGQHPWRWRAAENTAGQVIVELNAEFAHASFTLRIGIERDRSGFAYEARAINKLDHAYGAFNFNLPIAFSLADVTEMKLIWNEASVRRETTVASKAQSAFWISARGALTLQRPTWTMQIEASPEQTAGYFTDWGAGFITPDLHGMYRKLRVGEETIARWRFHLDAHRPVSPTLPV